MAEYIHQIAHGHDCLSALTTYERRLYEFGGQFKNVACTSTNIEVNLARLDLCPLSHAGHTGILNDLAISLSAQYVQGGKIADLNRAIQAHQTRLDLCPPGHPEHAKALGELAIDLWKHYCIQKNKKDLEKLIAMEERWLELCPSGHEDHGRALGELALSFQEHYKREGDVADLNKAIEMREKTFDLCPPDDPDYFAVLGNLALSILERYRRQDDLADLNRTIDLQEKQLELCHSNHNYHGLALRNLALSLIDRYEKMGSNSDLIKAIKLFKEGLNAHPVQHPGFAFIAGQLAHTILYTSNTSQGPYHEPLPSLNEAFETYRQLMACGPAVSLDLLEAVQDWVNNAEKHNHSSVLEAYQTLLNTLDHFTSLNSSLDSRHETMQERVADAVNDAFSCATWYGDFQMAVELLEQGRGILWNQLARFDISMVALESRDSRERELQRKFTRLSADLRNYAQQSGGSMDPYWRAQEEWQSVVDDIRHLDGFSRFLLPPHFDDLQQAAEQGPVIIVNASEYTCDALIVLHTRSPVHVDLSCSLVDVTQLRSQLLGLTQDAHAYGKHREFYVKEVLRELWSSVVEPIVSVLRNDVQLPPGSRIWWCPTSKFMSLPFHAAGPHRKTKKNLMDIYISSYAPSLSALIRARDRLRSQRNARAASGMVNEISFAAVGQARPSADAKLGELPEVKHELRRIHNETGMPLNVTFETVTGAEATIEGAVQAFRDHRWVHVACHGAQHAKKPFDSWFAMGDGQLTLMRIIQERYTNSEFAFLSACHTAVGDESTPDEVLHLAAGMQFAGFNGVIGTLWKVDDAVAHQVVTRFYQEMFKQPVLDFEYAATALNTAALETADEVSLEKRIVFVHIGI